MYIYTLLLYYLLNIVRKLLSLSLDQRHCAQIFNCPAHHLTFRAVHVIKKTVSLFDNEEECSDLAERAWSFPFSAIFI